MATETLRPNAAGDVSQLSRFPNTGEANWEDVDEVVADDDTTYLFCGTGTIPYIDDLYNLPAHSGTGGITSVTVHVRARAGTTTPDQASLKISCKTGGQIYYGSEETLQASTYVNYSKAWATNPGGGSWSWSDIDALQIGVAIRRTVAAGGAGCQSFVTQVYVVVDYMIAIAPSGIEQTIALGTPAVSKLQQMILPTGIAQPTAVGTPRLTKVAPAVPDLPDWMFTMSLAAARLVLPINVSGVSTTIPIDIKAVTIGTISVDIVAQTVGHLDVNIVAQAGDINVNIAAQAGDVTISLVAQTIAFKSQGEWSPQQGEQKYFQVSAGNIAYSYGEHTYYIVPAGKTLYITHLTFAVWAYAAADGDKDQIAYVHIRNHTDSTTLAAIGGSGGGGVSFPTPLKVAAGKLLDLCINNYANHAVNAWASCGGYEL